MMTEFTVVDDLVVVTVPAGEAEDHAVHVAAQQVADQLKKRLIVKVGSAEPPPDEGKGDVILTPEQASDHRKYMRAQQKAAAQDGVVRVIGCAWGQ
jgi:D-serine deaminase-like pyridoxal phosphate-dependent protein